jgi:hypothetical protein
MEVNRSRSEPITRRAPMFTMPDDVITPETLEAPGLRPGLLALRLMERRLTDRLAQLDARVDMLLHDAAYSEDDITSVDVLCASIAEVTELRDAARRDVVRERTARKARRSGTRRWG